MFLFFCFYGHGVWEQWEIWEVDESLNVECMIEWSAKCLMPCKRDF